ncbi:hypothetical protein PAECIP111802_05031 [Paenibacillus allorhizosphaerae]|uniref:Uncharacterized protein n=1 Tax=Paenibacillus allorhizosphaerae TaxID=2849866 RepID=A0ABM8VNN2_9BACL|nr:hypothetical protein PAECIP111802_05031 [Paenibacillus allorhizosphaerae]
MAETLEKAGNSQKITREGKSETKRRKRKRKE